MAQELLTLPSLYKELKSLASKWELLATRANLPQETVQSLKSGSGCPDSNSEQDSLREVLRHWIETLEQEQEEGGRITWATLLEVVRDIDMELAENLKAKFCSVADSNVEMASGEQESMEVKSKMDDDVKEKTSNNDGMEEEQKEEIAGGSTNDVSHMYSQSWSKLTREEIVDRVKGTIYGQAIGDALGLATEFMSKKEANAYYEKGLNGYQDIVQDFHRSRWDKSDWTDDTDQMLLIMLMIIEKRGKVDQLDFAAKIHNWMLHGFEELGDVGGMGIGMTVGRTLRHHDFLQHPIKAAEAIWEDSGRYLAANGAIMRTSILGTLSFNDIPKVVANTTDIAKITHADPRCSASCIAVTTAIALMLQGAYDLRKKDQLSHLIEKATEEGIKVLKLKDQKKEMKKYINSSLKEMHLDERQSIGYTFKALGAGFYGLHKGTNFTETITKVIMEGGDADSNAAVCGALMGCKLGFKALPEDLLQFKHREWLDKKVDTFLKTIGLAE